MPGLVRAMFTEPGAAGPVQQLIAQMTDGFVPTPKSALAVMTDQRAGPGCVLRSVDAATGGKVAATFRRLLAVGADAS